MLRWDAPLRCAPHKPTLTGNMRFRIGVIFILLTPTFVNGGWCEDEVNKMLWLNSAIPEDDAKAAIKAGDTKLMATHGFALMIPGVTGVALSEAIDKKNYRVIEGTGDDLCSEEHQNLNMKAIEYATSYNRTIEAMQ